MQDYLQDISTNVNFDKMEVNTNEVPPNMRKLPWTLGEPKLPPELRNWATKDAAALKRRIRKCLALLKVLFKLSTLQFILKCKVQCLETVQFPGCLSPSCLFSLTLVSFLSMYHVPAVRIAKESGGNWWFPRFPSNH